LEREKRATSRSMPERDGMKRSFCEAGDGGCGGYGGVRGRGSQCEEGAGRERAARNSRKRV
jgi:hypothetical protein